jgi:hypothetical protein
MSTWLERATKQAIVLIGGSFGESHVGTEMQTNRIHTPSRLLWRKYSARLISPIAELIPLWHQAGRKECPVIDASLAIQNRPTPGIGREDLCDRFVALYRALHNCHMLPVAAVNNAAIAEIQLSKFSDSYRLLRPDSRPACALDELVAPAAQHLSSPAA